MGVKCICDAFVKDGDYVTYTCPINTLSQLFISFESIIVFLWRIAFFTNKRMLPNGSRRFVSRQK